jgi:formate hydrogenlyase transcriptional activator
MQRQRNRRDSNTAPPRSPVKSEQGFLRFTQQLSHCRDAEDLLQTLPSTLHNLIPANTFMAMHVDGTRPASGFMVNGNGRKPVVPYDLSQMPSAYLWVHQNRKALVIPSVTAETEFAESMEWFRSNGDGSLCILPLSTALRPLGVICAGRISENAFTAEEVSLLVLAADHAALALDDRLNFAASEKARLQLEDERKKLNLILDLNNSVASNQEPRQLIQAISPHMRKVMQLDAVALMLPAIENGKLEVYAFDSLNSEDAIRSGAIAFPEHLPEAVFRSRKPWIGDVSGKVSQSLHEKQRSPEKFQAICFLPLIRCNRALGVLSVARMRRDSFTEQDVDFLLQIAGQIAIAIDNAVAYRKISELSNKLEQEKLYLEDEIRNELNFEEIVGNSTVLRRVLRQVEAVAPTDSTVLIYGETGSGKELIARAVHKLSRRSSHPFVKLNCAAIPTGLLESELFGHEKGAFTGAIAQRIGRFELASEGTIFLDEVGEIPLDLQPKLLRVLQEREFERLGSSRTLRSDARLIAATNRDLHAMVDSQRFRSDLFYRLNVFPILVPPLRERTEDIPFLVRHFAQHFARLMKKQLDTISSETMNALVRYPWPGNIRELQNVIERAVILSTGKDLKVPISDLKPRLSDNGSGNGVMTLEEMERRHILHVLEQSNWVFSGPNGAAARLGMKRPTLQFRMRKLGISRPGRP